MKASEKNKTGKVELRGLYAAMSIHRKVLNLVAMWTAFDPFGAIVYELKNLADEAWNLREEVFSRKDDWDFTKAPYYPLRPIKWEGNHYGTFKNHLKSIEGAIRRFLRNPWIETELDEPLTVTIDKIRDSIRELRSQM